MATDRLLGILTTLLQNEMVTAPQLAEKFEVSRRTISRDVDALCRAGIPLITSQGRGGGISIAAGYRLEASLLTQQEKQAMLASVKGLDGLMHSDHWQTLSEKMGVSKGKVMESDDLFLLDLRGESPDMLSQKMRMVQQAVQQGHTLCFRYYYAKGESQREVEPYRLMFYWGNWYLYAWCLQRQAFRMFKLNRLWSLEISPNGFAPRPVTLPVRNYNDAHIQPIELVALVKPHAKYRLIEEYGPACCTQQADGSILFKQNFYDKDYMQSYLLGMGSDIQVLEPQWVVESLVDYAQKIIALYIKQDS